MKSILFTDQQMHYLLNLERFKILQYNSHKYRSYMFRSSTIIRELVLSLAKVILDSVIYILIGYVVMWQRVLGVACVLCAVQNETELGAVRL
jgi:hypothetical protein